MKGNERKCQEECNKFVGRKDWIQRLPQHWQNAGLSTYANKNRRQQLIALYFHAQRTKSHNACIIFHV
jgi:hypothetical protein